jgi:tryptophanyl-tRNA synthetase
MARILTGVQSTGRPHLGNIMGAMLPAIKMANESNDESFLFIADLHTLTSVKDGETIKKNTFQTAAAWLALGLDTSKTVFYKQSDLAPEVCELTWYLDCFTPFPMLANAHSFKEKSNRLSDVNAGLFTYPVLMAADIIGYDAEIVPVGKDQKQHIEITRDIAGTINRTYNEEIFVIPEAKFEEQVMIIPGTDGQKMSKSYNNFIDIFLPDKQLRKQIMRIVTDSTPLEEPKNPETCNAFKIYSLIANKEQTETMRQKYLKGGYGYGHAKQELFELIIEKFAAVRERYFELEKQPEVVENELKKGAEKARTVIRATLKRLKKHIGY